MASYTEALLKSKKFAMDEKSRLDVYKAPQILLGNSDTDMNIKVPN